MLDSGIPDNCQGTPAVWMLVKEENKTMVSVALTMWASGHLGATIYTDPFTSGYCEVSQLDSIPDLTLDLEASGFVHSVGVQGKVYLGLPEYLSTC